MKASDLFIKCLENEGVKYVFGLPGEENLDFINSLKNSSIKFVVTRHEQAAGFMAATYGRLTGKTGVCLATLGPGATNLMTAVAYAQLGAMPVLFITGQKPARYSKQGQFQLISVVEMMRPLTKFTKRIVNGDSIPALVRESFRLAQKEKPGAVHLEFPEDIAEEKTAAMPFAVQHIRRSVPDEKGVQRAVEMIQAAHHPLVLVGAAANRIRVHNMLGEFLGKTGIYFFNTQMGKGVIDERHPQYLGCAALSEGDYIHCAIQKADLIINVGHDIVEKPPFIMKQGGTTVIHVNYFTAKVDEIYFPQWEVIGDIANGLWQMKEKIKPQLHWDFTEFAQVKHGLEEHLREKTESDGMPLKPQRIVADVRAAVPQDGILALDNGMYKIWFARNYKAYAQNTLLLDNSLAAMGAGLPSALAAKLFHPEKCIMAVCGDGGFMMNSQELETAVRLGIDLVVLIINDNGFGMIKWKQQEMGFDDFGLHYGNPDFVKYAESYGAKGYRVEKADELKPLLERCLTAHGIHVIEVPVDYSENERVFNKELKEKICGL